MKKIIFSFFKTFILLLGCIVTMLCIAPMTESTETHTVTFDSLGGTPVDPQTVEDGGYATEPEEPYLEGHIFVTWLLEDNSVFEFTTPITQDTDLHAEYNVSYHEITFDSRGGSNVPMQDIPHDGTVTRPADPTRDYYDFKGWYKEASCTNLYDFTSPVKGPFTLYADWTLVKHRVTFETNGGTEIDPQDVEHGSAITPVSTTKPGSSFYKWYKDPELSEEFNTTSPVVANMTLYASWRSGPCTVTFNTGAGSFVPSQTVENGEKATRPEDPTYGNKTFLYWYSDNPETAFDFDTPITEDIVLNAKWKNNLTYLKVLTNKTGYVFEWRDDANKIKSVLSEDKDTPYLNTDKYWIGIVNVEGLNYSTAIAGHEGSLPASNNYTSCAAFDIKVIKRITDDKEGQSVLKETVFTKTKQPLEFAIDLSSMAPKTGARLSKCSIYRIHGGVVTEIPSVHEAESNIVSFENDSFSTFVVYSDWSYTVTFNSNGGSAVAAQTVKAGGKAVEPKKPTKQSSTFMGWYEDEGLTKKYNFSKEVKSDLTLYAKWVNRLTVKFYTDGGAPIPDDQPVTIGEKASEPLENPVKKGYEFVGWYKNDVLYDFNTPVTENISLVAKYKLREIYYTVEFDAKGGGSPSSQIILRGNKVTKPSDPKKDGYDFKHWEFNGVEYDFNQPVISNMTLTAKYISNGSKDNDDSKDKDKDKDKSKSSVNTTGLTTVATTETGAKYFSAGLRTVTIVDKINYAGVLEAGKQYIVKGYIVNKLTGQVITDLSGTAVAGQSQLQATAGGSATMMFTFNPSHLPAGTSIVVFEEIYDTNNKLVAEHKDINDINQTLFVFKYDKVQTGVYPIEFSFKSLNKLIKQ